MKKHLKEVTSKSDIIYTENDPLIKTIKEFFNSDSTKKDFPGVTWKVIETEGDVVTLDIIVDLSTEEENQQQKRNEGKQLAYDIKYKLEDPNDRIYKVFKFNHYGDKIKDDPKYYDEQQILSEFRNWVAHTGYYLEPLLIMQNSIFDMNMLVGRGEKLPYEVLDTKQLLQLFVIPIIRKLSETDNKYQDILDEIGTSERDFGMTTSAMGKWGPFFGINMSGYHDALTDCKITAQMFTKMIDFIKDNSDLDISKYQSERIFVNKF